MDARILGFSTIFFVSAWATPAKTMRVDFRSVKTPAIVAIEKESPAYAALEDSRFEYINENENQINIVSEKLRVGLALKALKRPKIFLQLRGQVISQQSKANKLSDIIAKEEARPRPLTVAELGDVLVREELYRRAHLIRSNNNVKHILSSTGHEIIVAKPQAQIAAKAQSSTAAPTNTSVLYAFNTPPNKKTSGRNNPPAVKVKGPRHSIQVADNRVFSNNHANSTAPGVPVGPAQQMGAFSFKSVSPNGGRKSSIPGRYLITGTITFAGGAAILGHRDTILAEQIVDGVSTANGEVNHKEATYRILVDDLSGEIWAAVRNEEGMITAEGRVNLLDLYNKKKNIARIENVPITLRPVQNGVSVNIISAASHGRSIYKVADAKINIVGLNRRIPQNKTTGLYQDSSLVMPSNHIVVAERERFWPTIKYIESGVKEEVRLFPSALIEAFLNISLSKYAARDALNLGLIWGRVTYAGRPIEGAKAHIIGDEDKVATYFTGYIPDKNRIMTSDNGEFAFSAIKDREKFLSVELGGKRFWPIILPTKRGYVSYANLDIQPTSTVEFKSYEAFNYQPVEATLNPPGSEDKIFVPATGVTRVPLQLVSGITAVESHASEKYSPVRIFIKDGQVEAHMIQITNEWLEKLKPTALAGVNAPATAVVGFVNGDDFEVTVGSDIELHPENIVYFDGQGKRIEKKNAANGVSGGGFVIYNLPKGFHSITILPEKSKQVVTVTTFADEYAVQEHRINLVY